MLIFLLIFGHGSERLKLQLHLQRGYWVSEATGF
jgi:hypothetical protein